MFVPLDKANRLIQLPGKFKYQGKLGWTMCDKWCYQVLLLVDELSFTLRTGT